MNRVPAFRNASASPSGAPGVADDVEHRWLDSARRARTRSWIGEAVAGYGAAFGMATLVWSSAASLERARGQGLAVAASKEDFFARCDVLSLHLRLVPVTSASSALPTWRS